MIQQMKSWLSGPIVPVVSLVIVLTILAIMPIYPFATTWFGSLFGYPLIWKAIKDVVIALTALVLLVWVLGYQKQWHAMKSDWVLRLIVALIGLTLFSLLRHETFEQEVLAGLVINMRYILIFFIGYVALRYGGARFHVAPKLLSIVAGVGIGLAITGVLQVFVLPIDVLEQFGYNKETTIAPYIFIDDDPNAPRAFATLRGPNDYAAFLLVSFLAAAVLSLRNKWWTGGVFLMAFALVLSSSRSAWLGVMVGFAVLALIIYGKASARMRRIMMGLGVVGVVVGASLLVAATTVPALRLAVFHSSPDDTHLTEGSTDNHWKASAAGIERIADEPLGCGVGCSGPASYYSESPKIAENYFIQIAEEIGVIGLGVWVGLFSVVIWRLWLLRENELALTLFVSGIGLSIIGIWLHVWADDPVSLLWWGLTGVALGQYSASVKDNNQVDSI